MTPQEASQKTEAICRLSPIVPVLVVEVVAHAAPLARALVAGGLPALEVTLRTPAALDVIAAMAEIEGGVVGAGTLASASRPAPPMRCSTRPRRRACRSCPARPPPRKRCACSSVAIR